MQNFLSRGIHYFGEIFEPLHLSQGMLCILLSACSIRSRYFPMLVFLGSIVQQTQQFSEEDGIVTMVVSF